MSKKAHETALPKRRFPEFQDAEAWKTELFKDLYSFKGTNSLSRDKLNYEGGTVKNIHYGDIHTKFSAFFDITKEKVPFVNSSVALDKLKEENYCVEGDVIFADASEDLDDIGKSIEVINLNKEKVISGLHTQFARQKAQKLVVGFAGHLFMSSAIRAQIQNEAQGTKVLGISAGRLSKILVCYPSNKQEQQKIAATLSSLDTLLTAQTAKLTALQAHKRGLMQDLFPAEGETVPKLRFPEFQDAGEWMEKKLKDISNSIFDGTHQTPKYTEEGVPFFSVENVVSGKANKFISKEDYLIATAKNKPKKGDILLTRIGKIGFSVLIDWEYEFSVYVTLAVIKQSENFNSQFLHCYFQSDRYQNEILGSSLLNAAPMKINMDELRKTKVMLPPSNLEQQKIADCLSSLDNLITAQSQKIEALKLHKKGLMQALFPAAS